MREESQSLSPKVRPFSSSSATMSFSLMTGTMPARTRWSSDRRRFATRRRSAKSECVRRTWPIFTPRAAKSRSYSVMKRGWPTAAHIWTSETSAGRALSPSASTPAATAPELTNSTSGPILRSSQTPLTTRRSAAESGRPVFFAIECVPTFTTTRRASRSTARSLNRLSDSFIGG